MELPSLRTPLLAFLLTTAAFLVYVLFGNMCLDGDPSSHDVLPTGIWN